MHLKKYFIFIIFLLLSLSVYAHPHIFMENTFTFVFSSTKLEGIKVKWIFDEMFSASIIMDFDFNGNRFFEADEIAAIESGAFSNLANYDYFLHIQINGADYKITSVSNFDVEIDDNRIIYYFFLPLNLNVQSGYNYLSAGCYDNTYFCSILDPDSSSVITENIYNFDCSYEIIEDLENTYWETITPRIVFLKYRK
jgi:ABC-type uncharacterized transport system substrate-binding protein